MPLMYKKYTIIGPRTLRCVTPAYLSSLGQGGLQRLAVLSVLDVSVACKLDLYATLYKMLWRRQGNDRTYLFQRLFNYSSYPVDLLYCRMCCLKSKLMSRDRASFL